MSSFKSFVLTSVGLLAPLAALADSSFEFRLPTGERSPLYRSTSLTVPNDYVFEEIDDYEATLEADLRQAILEVPEIRRLNSFLLTFRSPTVVLTGRGTRVVASLSGVDIVQASVRYRPPESWQRFLCGSSVSAGFTIRDLGVEVDYDYYSGAIVDAAVHYSDVDANVNCSNILGDLLIDIFQFLGVLDEFDNLAAELIDASAQSLAGRYTNLFSLEDALAGFEEQGIREIREGTEDALAFLGGARSAAAAFIANQMIDELVARLGLQAQADIDRLRARLADLEAEIAMNLPGLDTMSLSQLGSGSFDLSSYLSQQLPNLEQLLLNRLNGLYANAVQAVSGLEARALNALEDLVRSDWGRIFGGVNVRLRIQRDAHRVILDAYHAAPASFVGRAEAMAPCFPNYTVAATENARSYSLYNGAGDLYYRGLDRTHQTNGLLSYASVESRIGLHSYPTNATISLYAWGDYPGGRAAFRWPRCPVAGQPPSGGGGGSAGGGGGTPPPPPPPPYNPPRRPPGGGEIP